MYIYNSNNSFKNFVLKISEQINLFLYEVLFHRYFILNWLCTVPTDSPFTQHLEEPRDYRLVVFEKISMPAVLVNITGLSSSESVVSMNKILCTSDSCKMYLNVRTYCCKDS